MMPLVIADDAFGVGNTQTHLPDPDQRVSFLGLDADKGGEAVFPDLGEPWHPTEV